MPARSATMCLCFHSGTHLYTFPMFQTRLAISTDASLIVAHRRAMFAAMGSGTPELLDEMTRAFEAWLPRRLADGRYLGWITFDCGLPVASIGLFLLEWPPHALDPTGNERAYILNLFVEPGYRHRGLARALIQLCLAEAARRRIAVTSLHASDEGRPLYESLGFTASNEMQFRNEPHP